MKAEIGTVIAAGALGAAYRHASASEEALASLPGDDFRQRAIELSRTTVMDIVDAVAYVKRYGLRRLPGEREQT